MKTKRSLEKVDFELLGFRIAWTCNFAWKIPINRAFDGLDNFDLGSHTKLYFFSYLLKRKKKKENLPSPIFFIFFSLPILSSNRSNNQVLSPKDSRSTLLVVQKRKTEASNVSILKTLFFSLEFFLLIKCI